MKDGKENTVLFWNAQNWSCIAERRGTHTALENRDVDGATATGKIPVQKGNKLNPNSACSSCSSTYHNIAIPYDVTPYLKVQCGMNTRISRISKCKLQNTRSTSAFI